MVRGGKTRGGRVVSKHSSGNWLPSVTQMEKGRTRFWIPSLTPLSISGKNSCWLEILKLLRKKGKRLLTTVSGSQSPDAFCQLTSYGVCPLLLALPISEPGWKCGSFAVPLTSELSASRCRHWLASFQRRPQAAQAARPRPLTHSLRIQ